jgi:hypothetical protein
VSPFEKLVEKAFKKVFQKDSTILFFVTIIFYLLSNLNLVCLWSCVGLGVSDWLLVH